MSLKCVNDETAIKMKNETKRMEICGKWIQYEASEQTSELKKKETNTNLSRFIVI